MPLKTTPEFTLFFWFLSSSLKSSWFLIIIILFFYKEKSCTFPFQLKSNHTRATLFPIVTENPCSLLREDVIATPSNKGNSAVVLDRASYLQRAQDLLSDASAYVPLTNDPRERIAFQHRLMQSALCCTEENLHQRIRVLNPRPLTSVAYSKTHQPAVPPRPVYI